MYNYKCYYILTSSRPAFFPAPEFVFNLIFGKERASIVTQSQVAKTNCFSGDYLHFQVVQPVRTLESGFEYQFPTIGNDHFNKKDCNNFLTRGGL